MTVTTSPASLPLLSVVSGSLEILKGERKIHSAGGTCTRPDRDAGAAFYSNQLGMSRVGLDDSRRNVQVNVKGENTLRGGKQLQLPFLYQGRCSITVVRRLPGLSSGREACQAPLSYTISLSLIKLMSIGLVMLSNHLILCRPLVLLPSIFLHQGPFQ